MKVAALMLVSATMASAELVALSHADFEIGGLQDEKSTLFPGVLPAGWNALGAELTGTFQNFTLAFNLSEIFSNLAGHPLAGSIPAKTALSPGNLRAQAVPEPRHGLATAGAVLFGLLAIRRIHAMD